MFDDFYKGFRKQLDIGEKTQVNKLKRFLSSEYQKGYEEYLNTSKTSGFSNLFNKTLIEKIYIDTYSSIGTRLANWYLKNNEKFINKNQNYNTIWQEKFAAVGSQVAAARVTIVQGSALKMLQRELKGRFKDPEFITLGAVEKARILRKRFNGISQWQAERIIRTESTFAANKGIMASAETIYGQNGYLKQWITSIDGRERMEHALANGQQVPKNEPFNVGGDKLMIPGDLSGRPSNVVNCRCAIAPVPASEPSLLAQVGTGLATSYLIEQFEENEN